MLLSLVSRYPLAHTSGFTTSRWDRVVMVTTTRVLRSRDCSIRQNPNHAHYSLVSRTRIAAVCDMSLVMNETDGSEGEDDPPPVQRTRRVLPRSTYNALSACTETLWCGELVQVLRSRAIAVVDYVARNLSKIQSVNSGASTWVVDPTLPVWFCDPKIHLISGFGHAIVRDSHD